MTKHLLLSDYLSVFSEGYTPLRGGYMVHFGILLTAGGIACAIWRDQRKKRLLNKQTTLLNNHPRLPSPEESLPADHNNLFDDVGEIHHYQRSSWYALALTASSAWFYPPIRLLSVPLLGYNTYYFFKTLQHSDKATQRSPMTLFEGISVAGSLITGSLMTTALLLSLSFSMRKLLLQAGNIGHNVGFSKPLSKKHVRVWVLREDAEIEVLASELQDDDKVVLHANDIIMLSGHVVDGEAEVLQFSLNKKIKRIEKRRGDQLHPFTKLASGHLLMQVS